MEFVEIEKTYRSFKRKEFEEYFSERGECKSPGYYIGEGWAVSLGEERKEFIGSIGFIAVTIHLKLSHDIKEEFIAHLRKSFLKGGG